MTMDEHTTGDTGMTGMVTILDVAPAGSNLPVSPQPVSRPISSNLPGLTGPALAGAGPWLIFLGGIAVVHGLRAGGRRRAIRPTLQNRKDNPQ
jgi:hypothetical protein